MPKLVFALLMIGVIMFAASDATAFSFGNFGNETNEAINNNDTDEETDSGFISVFNEDIEESIGIIEEDFEPNSPN